MKPTFVCLGEMLWDVLPTGQQPGGAPFNVAVHLRQLGQPVQLISRVGEDSQGAELRAFLASRGVSSQFVQHDSTHPTGVVQAAVDNRNEVTYQIVQSVAWDYIQEDTALHDLVTGADVFIYGSLAARNTTSRETLYRLLPSARLKVLDVNLRPPHYSRAVVEHLLHQADIVKLNHHELTELVAWFGTSTDTAAAMQDLATRFNLQAVCVTRGADGAALWTGGQMYASPGIAVEVKDTIGSGDAFLAAFLHAWHSGQPPQQCLRFACASGALVASFSGATPAITVAQIEALLEAGHGS